MAGMMRIAATGLLLAAAVSAQPSADAEFFERKVRPILENRCAICHGDKIQMAGLKLTTAEGFFRGADTGPVVTKGDPRSSRLIAAVSYAGKSKMPPTRKLDPAEIAVLKTWVEMGAPWPETKSPHPVAPRASQLAQASSGKSHWAFQPVGKAAPPPVRDQSWVQSPVDRFILARLDEDGLKPAPPADRLTLLRRAKFDLHGLPPSEQEIDEFLADTKPEAFARLVDRLLASPRYGEKWGRHWLDVARYGDSTGLDEDHRLPHSWRYRDYVIDAFNRDLPFDRFIHEQIAGDLLPAEKPGDVNVRGRIATGFLALGPKPLAQPDKVRQLYDVIDEQIDTVSKAFLGLTIACARCHDHKFDPVSTKDYYSLASIFANTKYYDDIDPVLSVIHMEPLVNEQDYQTYKKHQDEIRTVERRADAIMEPEINRYISVKLRPRLAEYMIAARRSYETGEGAVIPDGLDEKILKKWVEYLKPGLEFRPYLEKWHAARGPEVQRAAQEYQQLYDEIGTSWDKRVNEWIQKVDGALREGKVPPGKPGFGFEQFNKPEDRFFEEVSFKDGPFSLSKEEREQILSEASRQQVAALRKEVDDLKKNAPPEPPMAHAVCDGDTVEQRVFIRGSHHNRGDAVAKQFPVILAGDGQTPITDGSGRKHLSEWLTRPDHPLTARVMANRIWHWHFGHGLVRTPDNFGLMGERPTHPELLDYLATEFVNRGWSIKAMHRLMMLSSAYQMSSIPSPQAVAKDADNRFWSRFHRRRLEVEEMRDSLLAVDGALDLTMGGSLASKLRGDQYEKRDSVDPAKIRRRSVYLPLVRNKLPNTLKLFDFVDSTTTSGKRMESSIAPQALYLLNSEFAQERSRSLAKFLLAGSETDDAAILRRAFRIAWTREPEPGEATRWLDYMTAFPKGDGDADPRLEKWQSVCWLLLSSNEFHYVE